VFYEHLNQSIPLTKKKKSSFLRRIRNNIITPRFEGTEFSKFHVAAKIKKFKNKFLIFKSYFFIISFQNFVTVFI